MGLYSLFNKDVQCEKCGIILKNNQMGTFDTSHQGRNKDGRKIRYCSKCMVKELMNSLNEFHEKAIIIYPSPKFNAYGFYQFESLIENARDLSREEELVNSLRSFLPPESTKCSHCNNEATYTLCSLGIFKGENPYSWEINLDSEFEYKFVCRDCLVNDLSKKISETEIVFTAVYPPIRGEGFLTPWEV